MPPKFIIFQILGASQNNHLYFGLIAHIWRILTNEDKFNQVEGFTKKCLNEIKSLLSGHRLKTLEVSKKLGDIVENRNEVAHYKPKKLIIEKGECEKVLHYFSNKEKNGIFDLYLDYLKNYKKDVRN